jgi:hypothetical protein
MFKRLAAATVMLCAAGGALADNQQYDISIPMAPNSYYQEVAHGLGSFADTFTFTIPDGSLGISANILPVLSSSGDGSFARHISDLSYSIWDSGSLLQGSYVGGMAVSLTALTAGDYTLKVVGIADGRTGGTYGIDLSVSAVPEPATYGMMLVGLGLVGLVKRRRDASNDKFK